jgi:hypothetical protein
MNNYGLDPLYYYTAPGLAWDTLFKKTKAKVELLTDSNMLLFFESSIKGGIFMIYNRYGKVNNIYMKKCNNNKPQKYIAYWDANNLYGWAISQYLPISNYR